MKRILFYIVDTKYVWTFLSSHHDLRPMLEVKQKFQDSLFSASASTKGHSPSDARISSGSSWCAPVADGKHYLQVDLRRLFRLYYIITYGDATNSKWVASYKLNNTVDLVNWQTYSVRKNDSQYKMNDKITCVPAHSGHVNRVRGLCGKLLLELFRTHLAAKELGLCDKNQSQSGADWLTRNSQERLKMGAPLVAPFCEQQLYRNCVRTVHYF